MSETTSQANPSWTSEIAVLIRHPTLPRVLLIDERVPLYRFEPLVESSNAEDLARALRAAPGCEALLLGSLWGEYDDEARRHRAVVMCLARNAGWQLPDAARWVDAVAPEALPWPDAPAREAIAGFLPTVNGAPVPRRQPWAMPGWFQAASAWAEQALHGTPWQLTGAVQQRRVWGISCVLRAPTARGDVYLKAAGGSALFADEPAVMAALSRHFADIVPAPLARELEQRWMLLPDVGMTLRRSSDVEQRVAAMVAHGRMQVALAGEVEQLLAWGLHDRRLSVLSAQIAPLLADATARGALGDALYSRLLAAAPRLHALLDTLAGYAIPPTVVHGDLHAGNVAVRDGRFATFDWTDASVTHPFFDLVTFGRSTRELPGGDALAERITAAYLALWEAYESPERLRDAWRLARIAGSLHQAVSYRSILSGLEDAARWEQADGLVRFTADLLDQLDGLITVEGAG